jgi:glycosyltransferase involved in cell wall biosynthesis
VRVVHVLTRTNIGGVSNYLWHLLSGSSSAVEHIVVRGISSNDEGDYFDQHRVPNEFITISSLQRSSSFFDDIRTFVGLVQIFRRLRPDIVHTHMAKAGALGRLAAVVAGVRVRVHTFHGHLLYGYFSATATRLIVLVERFLKMATTHAIANGETVRRDLVRLRVIRDAKSSMIAPAVSPIEGRDGRGLRDHLGLPQERFVVGFLGRLAPIKRPDRVLDLARRLPEMHFVLVGDGPLRQQIVENAKHLSNVTLRGWVDDASQVLPAFDALVLTSDNEAIAIVLIEAATAGVSLVAMDVGSVGEIVRHGETGLLAHDLDSLESALRSLMTDQNARAKMSKAARHLATTRFTRRQLVEAHESLYMRLVGRNTRRESGL